MPWDDQINPLLTELVSHVEGEAWLALESDFMHADEERLPLAYLTGAIVCTPPLDCLEAAPYEQELPPAPLSRLLPLLVLPALERWGQAAMAVTGYRRLLSSACEAYSAPAASVFLHTCPVTIEK